MRLPSIAASLLLPLLLAHGGSAAAGSPPAETLYRGGTVLTLDGKDRVAEAVAVRGGRVVAVGSDAELASLSGPATRVVELQGRALLPGFIDGHSHLSHALQFVHWANVSQPPVGPVTDIPGLIAVLQEHRRARGIGAGEWVIGYGYARDGLAEGRELTRDDLDAAFPDNPVMLLHVSGHGAVFSSRAFEMARVGADTPDPPGGVIVRKPGGTEPAGLVMETAMFPLMELLPKPDPASLAAALDDVQRQYASNGYTTIQDGATDANLLALLRGVAARGGLWLDVVSLPVVARAEDFEAQAANTFGRYEARLKLGGIKFVLDGSPQGKTAYFTQPLLTGGPGGEKDWRGKPFMAPADYEKAFGELYRRGVQVWSHANGDAAIDMVIAAHDKAGAKAADDRRDVVIHSQFVRPDQLEAYRRFGIGASFFTNHAFFWGEVHRRNLGEERARFLSPLAAADALGVRFSNHTDYGVTPLDPLFTLWSATTRLTRNGTEIGPDQRVGTKVALHALTTGPAYLYREEDSKGSIEAGKLADFVLLDRDPLGVEPERLRELRILATVKEDRLVWGAF